VSAEFTQRAQALLGASSDHVDLLWSQGLLARRRGELDTAAEHFQRALFLARRQQLHWEVCECLLELAWNDLDRGDHARVLEHAAQLTEVAGKLGDSAFIPAAGCIRALAALSDRGAPVFAELDGTLSALRAAGASRLSSSVQTRAAQRALRAGEPARARAYA
jgi:hypothetical protein